MKSRNVRAGALMGAALLACGAAAFEVTKTPHGQTIRWETPSAEYRINSSSAPSGASAAIQSAMAAWNAVPKSVFRFSYGGTTTLTGEALDYQNTCSFGSVSDMDEDTLAYNAYWFDPQTGEIFDSDIIFNTAYSWAVTGDSDKLDVQNIATHELGHSLALDDLYRAADSEKTMYGYGTEGETKKRTLEADDMAGIVSLYPNMLPDLALVQPAGWTDKCVISAEAGTTTDSEAFTTADTLYLDWAVENSGGNTVYVAFQVELYVDGVLRNTWTCEPPLSSGAPREFYDYPLGALSEGTHTVTIKADTGGVVKESVESDNTFSKTVTVKYAASVPPLTVGVKTDTGPLTRDEVVSAKLVSGKLPSGMKIEIRDGGLYIIGVPLQSGSFPLVIQPSIQVGGTTVLGEAISLNIKVAALERLATGVFDGWMSGAACGPGILQLTVNASGKVTGKLSAGGTNYAFSAAAFDSASDGLLSVRVAATSGKAAIPLQLSIGADGRAAAELSDDPGAGVYLFRNSWKEAGMAAALEPFIGYYTAVLAGDAGCGSGYLTFTCDKTGKVKTAGKLADGTAVSLSGTLLMGGDGRVFAVVYTAPAAFKGGCLFGLAEFVKPEEGRVYLRQPDGEPFLWRSRNPLATGAYGAGYDRSPSLVGGWYGKTGDLGAYYAGRTLTAGTDTNAPAPELTVGTMRYDPECWDPSGTVLTPVVKSGAMTGLAAPAAGKPADPDKDGVWDYSAANVVGLKMSLARPTGLFKGSFLAWFDYPEKKHVSKSLPFEGVLTPERQDQTDGVEGRGFFLWKDSGTYLSPAGKTVAYTFNVSYDFLLLSL